MSEFREQWTIASQKLIIQRIELDSLKFIVYV